MTTSRLGVTRTLVTFANSAVVVDAVGTEAERLVTFLFHRITPVASIAPHAEIEVHADSTRLDYRLRLNGAPFCTSDSPAALATALLGQVLFHLVDRSSGGLAIHAAAVAIGTRVALFPGVSGAGKTTLTAWLATRGFEYLTDELVFIPDGSETVVPFPRPLVVKAAARTAIAEHVVALDEGDAVLHGRETTLVDPLLLGAAPSPAGLTLATVVFPTFQAGADRVSETLTRSEAGAGLMGGLINARNLPAHGFPAVAALARRVPAMRLRYGQFGDLSSWIDDLRATLAAGTPESH